MNDFNAEPAALRSAELVAVERVLNSGWYVLGQEVRAFEQAWAGRCGTTRAAGVGNGMDAIEIGLRALDVGPGDEVITTPMTAFATVLAIVRAGATPVLADIDPRTALLAPESVERCITSQTRAVVLVHLYGQIHDMDNWVELCARHGIALLEDCAQAHLAEWNGKVAGSFGRAGAYSFYPTKNLGAIGDGGALVSSDAALMDRVEVLRNYGQSVRYEHPELGLNSRLDELQAALLQVRLDWLDGFTRRRQEIAASYRAGLENPLVRLLQAPGHSENHVYHLFVITCEERERLSGFLEERGVATLIHYPMPVHHQPPCRDIRRDPQGLAASEGHAGECLSLPCHPQLSNADVAHVIKVVNDFC